VRLKILSQRKLQFHVNRVSSVTLNSIPYHKLYTIPSRNRLTFRFHIFNNIHKDCLLSALTTQLFLRQNIAVFAVAH